MTLTTTARGLPPWPVKDSCQTSRVLSAKKKKFVLQMRNVALSSGFGSVCDAADATVAPRLRRDESKMCSVSSTCLRQLPPLCCGLVTTSPPVASDGFNVRRCVIPCCVKPSGNAAGLSLLHKSTRSSPLSPVFVSLGWVNNSRFSTYQLGYWPSQKCQILPRLEGICITRAPFKPRFPTEHDWRLWVRLPAWLSRFVTQTQ